jgi:hypothetical protein
MTDANLHNCKNYLLIIENKWFADTVAELSGTLEYEIAEKVALVFQKWAPHLVFGESF